MTATKIGVLVSKLFLDYILLNHKASLSPPQTQDVNLTSYVRSIHVVCLRVLCHNCYSKQYLQNPDFLTKSFLYDSKLFICCCLGSGCRNIGLR